jgi:hypothetical protein
MSRTFEVPSIQLAFYRTSAEDGVIEFNFLVTSKVLRGLYDKNAAAWSSVIWEVEKGMVE